LAGRDSIQVMAEAAKRFADAQALTDEEVVERVRNGERALYELLMRRHNQRIYRAARAIVRDPAEAEDVMQDAYVRAYENLATFAGRATFATWLTKIAVHEALARVRRRGRFVDAEETMPTLASDGPDPEQRASERELGAALEAAIDTLPDGFRAVFVMRDVEGLSTAETADCLGINEETVKTRLHRARTALRARLLSRAQELLPGTFSFGESRCDRVVAAVLSRIGVGP
jgi:RNA polymerase sigma-70 factor, ECF subfamily